MMTKIKIIRTYLKDVTLGEAILSNGIPNLQFKTLELPFKNNDRRVSCIPEGVYMWKKHISPKFGATLWIQDVANRSEILLHSGNFTSDTLGCILPGEKHSDINNDGVMDVTRSRNTMTKILDLCTKEGMLYIF
jgi:hypothetical protein